MQMKTETGTIEWTYSDEQGTEVTFRLGFRATPATPATRLDPEEPEEIEITRVESLQAVIEADGVRRLS